MRTDKEIDLMFDCWKQSKSKMLTSKETGIPRKTVCGWFKKFDEGTYPNRQQEVDSKSTGESPCEFESHRAYSYVLGLYLGDGHISKTKTLRNGNGVYRLRIVQDAKYPKLIEKHIDALQELFPNNSVGTVCAPGCKHIYVYSNRLVDMFPQHGPGKKHDRKIELTSWQKDIIKKFPREFIAGLYESDGCQYLSTRCNGKYEYLYVEFSNKSSDIHELFRWSCSLIGVGTKMFSGGKTQGPRDRKGNLALASFLLPKS